MILFSFPHNRQHAEPLAKQLNITHHPINIHRFPDDESLVTLPGQSDEHIILFCSLEHPNNKLIELLFCSQTLRARGTKRLSLIAPYLCYMRQDTANQPGEAISQRIIGQLLAEQFDDVITVDPHLHRINDLHQVIPLKHVLTLTAAPLIHDFLKEQLTDAILLGPDQESLQWVQQIAQERFDFAIASKIRHGDQAVEITLPHNDFSTRPVVIIDDVVSTGFTLSQTVQQLRDTGASQINVMVTHPLFCDNAESRVLQSGVNAIWSTDSISHSSNVISLTELLSNAVCSIV